MYLHTYIFIATDGGHLLIMQKKIWRPIPRSVNHTLEEEKGAGHRMLSASGQFAFSNQVHLLF